MVIMAICIIAAKLKVDFYSGTEFTAAIFGIIFFVDVFLPPPKIITEETVVIYAFITMFFAPVVFEDFYIFSIAFFSLPRNPLPHPQAQNPSLIQR